MYIIDTAENLFKKLQRLENDIKQFSHDLETRGDSVPQMISEFESTAEKLQSNIVQKKTESNPIDAALIESTGKIRDKINEWNRKIVENKKGTEFMHKHAKCLVIMVFGVVKSGKSTLGNFFAGREFLHADFDNPYKHIEHPKFETEENARDTGGFKTDEDGLTWFAEGVTDTTGDIQYFTISSLRWIDSPGTGALKKQGDKKNMEDLVKEYLPYVDMCIFLMNSSEPGLQDDMKYMVELAEGDADALVLITKSDLNEEDIDDNGKVTKIKIPKTDSVRKKQEDDICSRLQEQYPQINAEKFRALSVSTILAQHAVENRNDDEFRGSNLDKFMQILGEKVTDNVIEKKKRQPRKVLNNFIDNVLAGSEQIKTALESNQRQIENIQSTIDKKIERISRRICSDVRSALNVQMNRWDDEVNSSGRSIGSSVVSNFVSDQLVESIQKIMPEEIKNIIGSYQQQEDIQIGTINLEVGSLEKQTRNFEYRYSIAVVKERDSHGIIEGIQSFFGKKFYRTSHKERIDVQKIDIGTNREEFQSRILDQIQPIVTNEARSQLENLRDNYFNKQEEFLKSMLAEIQKLQSNLQNLKY